MVALFDQLHRGLQWLLTKPVTALANRVSSAPKRQAVFQSLSELYAAAIDPNNKRSEFIELKLENKPIIIFSDIHKGNRNGADDFGTAEKNYLAALQHYNSQNFYYIILGDSEELWENNIFSVLKHNKASFAAEKAFVDRDAFCKVYGNHDIFWKYDPLKNEYLKTMYGKPIPIFGGIAIRVPLANGESLDVFCTHGHQGDASSDGNWLSAAFVTYIWGPLQAFLRINTNTPAQAESRKTLHNSMMYDWSAEQKRLVLITGHTHQPVFMSLTHVERLYSRLQAAVANGDAAAIASFEAEIPRRRQQYDYINEDYAKMKPTYFNTGCCCYSDGTISGIEISDEAMRLVLWKYDANGVPTRTVAEAAPFTDMLGVA